MAARRMLLRWFVLVWLVIAPQPSATNATGELFGSAAQQARSAGAQIVPANIRRVGADRSPVADIDGIDTPLNVDIAIIDSGVQLDHPDLNIAGSAVCANGQIDPAQRADDLTGHGTAVASVIGARDNAIGVVGVAPGARIWPIRVASRAADGRVIYRTADVVCAMRWLVEHADVIDVANLSLGSYTPFPIDDGQCGQTQLTSESDLHRSICDAVAAGVTIVVAAGEPRPSMPRADAAFVSPAAFDEVITVAAMADFDGTAGGRGSAPCPVTDRDDTFWDASNYGVDVDLIAPGVCIETTEGMWAGTSFAAPHVAGAAALYRLLHPFARPAEIRQALIASADREWNTSATSGAPAGDDPDGTLDPLLNVAALTRHGRQQPVLRMRIPDFMARLARGTHLL